MRQIIVAIVVAGIGIVLTGCGGGSSPAPASQYAINLSIQLPSSNHSSVLAYGGDATGIISISGGSISDANYPKHIKIASGNTNIQIIDTHKCLASNTAHQSCQFTIRNSYAGPNVTSTTDAIQVTADENGETLSSNKASLSLTGHASACAQALCLQSSNSTPDSFGNSGLLHNNVEYQVTLTIGNPVAAGAPSVATTFSDTPILSLNNSKVALLTSDCSNTSCTYTLQNENTATNRLATTDANISASATIAGASTKSTTDALTFVLPILASCTATNSDNQSVAGIQLSNSTLTPYESGTAQTTYTNNNISAMYPVKMDDYTIDADQIHSVNVTVQSTPYLFSEQANDNIPTSSKQLKDGKLVEANCTDAATVFNKTYTHPKNTPLFEKSPDPDVTQACSDTEQTRVVRYAVPKGNPPSANGWPVIIMFPGYLGQTTHDYKLTPGGKTIVGSASYNIFNNGWDWSSWETNPVDPKPTSSLYSYSYYVRMRLIKTWLSRGFAVIEPTTWAPGNGADTWSYKTNYLERDGYPGAWPMPSIVPSSGPNSVPTYLNYSYWPGMDGQFVEALMAFIADPKQQGVKFDLHNIHIFGYSAGANMVSRMINEFPSLHYTLDNKTYVKFPALKSAEMLAGGSYSCYADNTSTCPTNGMEQYYYDVNQGVNNIKQHPPTLLADSLYDDNAGTPIPEGLATSKYYDAFIAACKADPNQCTEDKNIGADGVSATYQAGNRIQIIHTDNKNMYHYYFPEMVIPSLNMMLNNTCIPKVST